MNTLRRITQAGTFGTIKLYGKNMNNDMGLIVDLDDPNGTVFINYLELNTTFVPITLKSGNLIIRSVFNLNYGGDLIDVYATNKASLHIDYLFSRGNFPTRPYKEYHQDILQLDYLRNYRSFAGGVVRDIYIGNMDVRLHGDKAQGIVMTGACFYTNIRLGVRRMHVELDGYPHLVNAYQLKDSAIGGVDNKINGDVFIKPRNKNFHESSNIIITNTPVNRYGLKGLMTNDVEGLSVPDYLESLAVRGIPDNHLSVA